MDIPLIDKIKIYLLPNILKRLLRIGIFNVLEYKDMKIIVLKKKILISKSDGTTNKIKIDRGSRPLKNGVALLDGKLYYGDYWGNPNREPAYIYEVDLSSFEKKILFTFDWVRHIHCVQVDKYEKDCLLIGTGDSDSESGIYRLNVQTKELEVLAQGAQKYRTVSIIQTKEKFFYGSDDPDGENYIYAYDKSSCETKPLCKIEGPAYYSTVDKKGYMYIATTIEDRKRHRAIIYRSKEGGASWQEYREFKKDIWHTKYFGYGVIEFVNGQDELEELEYKLVGLKEMN
ncbi:MAG: hypothetical protein ACQESP_10395 [Candidatus Muiribacteriota bacterium]